MSSPVASADDPLATLVRALHVFEDGLRQAYAAGAHLAAAASQAQVSQGLSPIVGHRVLAAISNANLQVSMALGHSADGHRLIEKLGECLGIDVTQYGDVNKDPAPGFTSADAGHLRVAA